MVLLAFNPFEGNDELIMTEMPKIIYGTAWKKDKTTALVKTAIEAGFRGIDTACQPKHYNEPGVGVALKQLFDGSLDRKDIYIQTKFTPIDGQDPKDVPYDRNAPLQEQIFQSFEASKKNLHVDYLDGLLLHSPLESFERTLIAWKAFEAIHHQKGATSLGISNCYDLGFLKHLHKKAAVKPSIVQNRFYQATGYDHEIRAWCLANNVVYQSFWTLTANPHLLNHPFLLKAAQDHQKTPAQILFCFLSGLGVVPLTGTSSEQHMKEDLEISTFSLSADETQKIASIVN